jgi:polysaccharide export outer membrane protein
MPKPCWPSQLLAGTLLLGAIALPCGNAVAQDANAPYHVGPGDVLSVVAYGNPALTGTYPVDNNGTIGYPIIGHVPVAGLTTPEIGADITKALAEHVAGLTVTVSINAYAPVFVLGDVATPGSYQYRPGMIVLELVALSGGQRRLNDPRDDIGLQFITARQQYSDLSMQVFALEVKRKRLEAERDGVPFVYAVPARQTPADAAMEQAIIDAERNIMTVRAKSFQAEDDALTEQEQSFKSEIASITESIQLHDEEVASLGADVAAAQSLVDRHLATDSSLRSVERNLSVGKRDALDLLTAKARAQQGLLDIGYRRTVIENTRANDTAQSLRDLDLEIARDNASMVSLMDTMGELAKLNTASVNAAARQGSAATHYVITRMVAGKWATIQADTMTALLPGDIMQATTEINASAANTVAQLAN